MTSWFVSHNLDLLPGASVVVVVEAVVAAVVVDPGATKVKEKWVI